MSLDLDQLQLALSQIVGDGGQAPDRVIAPALGQLGAFDPTARELLVEVAAQHAGYAEELKTHRDAGTGSFGCGNPLAFVDVAPGERVLDLGSGAGFDLLIAAGKVGAEGHVIGVDMTDAMIDAARQNIERARLTNVEIRKLQTHADAG